jgi:hypothetical protein
VVDGLMEVAGLATGYRRTPESPLERIFRDLRSASLMYSNDRLLLASGRLGLLDREARSYRALDLADVGEPARDDPVRDDAGGRRG